MLQLAQPTNVSLGVICCHTKTLFFMRVMAQVASRWLLIAGDGVGSHGHHCWICDGHTRTGTRFSLSTWVLLCQYRSTKAPRIYSVNLTLTLYNISE